VRILLDECLPARLKTALPGHAVTTVPEAGWRSSKDGPLLKFAEGSFDIFITVDRRMETELDLPSFRLGFVILHTPSNRLVDFQPILPLIAEAVARVGPGKIEHIHAPRSPGRL
jgi:hypothetical protein